MENYICINGKKTELTPEQLKQLGIELPKANPFAKHHTEPNTYFINGFGTVQKICGGDHLFYDIANYCTDKEIMEQRALHETLSRLLWRYAMEHDGDKIDWNSKYQKKYHIFVDVEDNRYHIDHSWTCCGVGRIYFAKESTAKAAIEEIIKPFMNAHPEFKF